MLVCQRILGILSFTWFQYCAAQKGVASLNDPCDCMQNHDYWVSTKLVLNDMLGAPNFTRALLDPQSLVHRWVKVQTCMYSPENEEAHRPTALSDCIPGFLLIHIICMQRQIQDRNVDKVSIYASELMRLLPFGKSCIDTSSWPISSAQVVAYYRRIRLAIATGPPLSGDWSDDLLLQLVWNPSAVQTPFVIEPGETTSSCPWGTLEEDGLCWLLGRTGASCNEACNARNLEFKKPYQTSVQPMVTRLLQAFEPFEIPVYLHQQQQWEAFECYVPGEDRFHMLNPMKDMSDGHWQYSICRLACPCIPRLPPSILEALQSVSSFSTVA